MSAVGQIIYNLKDQLTGGYSSTSASTFLTGGIVTASSVDETSYKNGRFNIFTTDIPQRFGPITKLGIQAPPGTRFIINENKTIMVGRTGIYELDDDIVVEHLTFVRPYKYELDVITTQQRLEQGIQGFTQAENQRQNALQALNVAHPDLTSRDETYWNQYQAIQTAYNEKFKIANASYTMGINGVYVLPNPGSAMSDENFEEVYDVIVDFVY